VLVAPFYENLFIPKSAHTVIARTEIPPLARPPKSLSSVITTTVVATRIITQQCLFGLPPPTKHPFQCRIVGYIVLFVVKELLLEEDQALYRLEARWNICWNPSERANVRQFNNYVHKHLCLDA
jgi:hypothetical protein